MGGRRDKSGNVQSQSRSVLLAFLQPILIVGLPILLMLLLWPFADHAVNRGMQMNALEEISSSRLHHADQSISNLAIYGHMIAGGLLTILAPLQLITPLRQNFPVFHRFIGYILAGLAVLTGIGGLVYILWQGTIGGWAMNIGFGIYGALVIGAAVQTVKLARQRNPSHREWALRLVVLALGSWLYRIHYGVWYLLTDGACSRPDFSGGFDLIQNFAFYLPYLLILEIWMRSREDHRALSFPSR